MDKEYPSHAWHKGPGDHTSQTAMENRNESYYIRAKRSSGLHDLLSHHHWAIWKRCLGWPGSSFRYLLDCTFPPKQQWSCNLTNFMCLQPNRSAILLGSRPIHVADDLSVVFWGTHFFLLITEMNRLVILGRYCSVYDNYFLKALMGHSSSLSLLLSTKSSKEGIVNSSKTGSWIKEFLVLAKKSGTKANV